MQIVLFIDTCAGRADMRCGTELGLMRRQSCTRWRLHVTRSDQLHCTISQVTSAHLTLSRFVLKDTVTKV